MKPFLYTTIALSLLGTLAFIGTYEPSEPQGMGAPAETPCRADTSKAVHERITECPVPANERASFKGQQIANEVQSVARTNVKFSGADYDIEIVETKAIEKGVEVYARAWHPNGEQIGFGKDGTVDIERFVIINPPVLVPDPSGDVVRTSNIEKFGQVTHTLREDPKEALLQVITSTLKAKQQTFSSENIKQGKVGNTTLTAFPNAGTGSAPIDGELGGKDVNDTWSNVRSSGGNVNDDTGAQKNSFWVRTTGTTNEFEDLYRTGYGFDTSSVGTDQVDSATISFYDSLLVNNLGDTDVEIVSFSPASESDYVNSDFAIANWGSTSFGAVNTSSITSNQYNDITLNNSGQSHINKSGNTIYGIRAGWDLDDSPPTWSADSGSRWIIYHADETGTTKDPKLVIEHSAAAEPVIERQSEFWF